MTQFIGIRRDAEVYNCLQDLLHHGGFFGLQNMISEDPGHRHLNRELDATTHGELQEELSEPQL